MTTDMINNTINANSHNPDVNTDDICDGFHTFGQLYHQRMMLFATLVNLFPDISWKTKRHEDGEECFGGGWFLVTIETPAGAYGYHYRMENWDKFNCIELDKARPWDGYTEENVDRLFSLISYKSEPIEKFDVCPSCGGKGMVAIGPGVRGIKKCENCKGEGRITIIEKEKNNE